MELDNINNETKEINLSEIIKKDTHNILNATSKINLWMPTNYNNKINEATGTTKLNYPGILEFILEYAPVDSNDDTPDVKGAADSKKTTHVAAVATGKKYITDNS